MTLSTLATTPATGTKLDTYTWNPEERRYRHRSGRLVSREDVRRGIDRYTDNLQAEVGDITERLVAGELEVGEWQIRMERIVKRAHVTATMIAKGGKEQVGAKEWGKTGAILKFEYDHLYRFARQLEAGRPLNGGTVARAKMYAIAATSTYENILRDDDISEGFDVERRHRHSDQSCDQCIEYEARGWQRAGVLPGIGQRCKCLKRCRCTFERKRSAVAEAERARMPPRPKRVRKPATPEAPQQPAKPPATMAELRRRLKGVPSFQKELEITRDYLKELEEPGLHPRLDHGMTGAESLRRVVWGDTEWFYPEGGDTRSPIVRTWLNMAIIPDELPSNLTRHTRRVTFTGQSNKQDGYWKVQYNDPNHVSGATGGDGGVVIYNGKEGSASLMAHEMGHNLALGKYGRTEPGLFSDFRKAIDSGEPKPTTYAANSDAEDFAESVMSYFGGAADYFRKYHPKRHAVIDRLMKEDSYNG